MSHSIKKLIFLTDLYTFVLLYNTKQKNIINNCNIMITALHWVNIVLARKLLHSIEKSWTLQKTWLVLSGGTRTRFGTGRKKLSDHRRNTEYQTQTAKRTTGSRKDACVVLLGVLVKRRVSFRFGYVCFWVEGFGKMEKTSAIFPTFQSSRPELSEKRSQPG